MASQCTHIILANKIFDQYFKDKDRKKFFIGTCFPDIRYLGVIERDKTHSQKVNLQEITQQESFYTGLQFHSLVDNIMGDFYVKTKSVYSLVPKSEYITQSIKILVDRILYHEIGNWEEYINYFNDILEEELSFGIEKKQVEKWHHLLQHQLKAGMDNESLKELANATILPPEAYSEIKDTVDELNKNQKIKDLTFDFYNQFPVLLDKYQQN